MDGDPGRAGGMVVVEEEEVEDLVLGERKRVELRALGQRVGEL